MVPELSSYEFKDKKIPAAFTGKDIVQRIYAHADEFFSIPSIQTNLWRLDEEEWEHVPEIKELLERAKERL
jgi:cobalamin biosynthesis Co2+ chelatase CbiK